MWRQLYLFANKLSWLPICVASFSLLGSTKDFFVRDNSNPALHFFWEHIHSKEMRSWERSPVYKGSMGIGLKLKREDPLKNIVFSNFYCKRVVCSPRIAVLNVHIMEYSVMAWVARYFIGQHFYEIQREKGREGNSLAKGYFSALRFRCHLATIFNGRYRYYSG